MIKHKNISIRAIEKDDLYLLQSWRNNEELRRYFREYRDFSMDQKEDWYQKMTFDNRFEMFMILDNATDLPMGVSGFTYIDWLNRHCDLHFYIGHEGQWIDEKYAPAAMELMLDRGFNFLNMNKIWAEIYEIDTKKKNFFENCGFAVDACHRQHYYYNGKYYNSYILSILKEEYEASSDNRSTPR
tara:strand:+ start:1241 stop:1795 length:555 start_codon:yes stop_codon:yes gene_type:complete